MTREEAKAILLLYHPDRRNRDSLSSRDPVDSQMREALEMADADHDLRAWFEQHCAFQRRVSDELRALPVPAARPADPRIKLGPSIWWTRRTSAIAAAAAILVLGLGWWWRSQPPSSEHFENFRSRMARNVLRQYQMDIETADMRQLRSFLESKGAPSDYVIPGPLQSTPLTGGGALTWRSNPVSMVCFDRGQKQMIFLFVLNADAVPDPPPQQPRIERVSKLLTASWSKDGKSYLMATEADDLSVLSRFL